MGSGNGQANGQASAHAYDSISRLKLAEGWNLNRRAMGVDVRLMIQERAREGERER